MTEATTLDELWNEFAKQTFFRTPFKRGVHDCCTFVASWAQRIQPDIPLILPWEPGVPLTDAQALRHITKAGGLAKLVDKALDPGHWYVPAPELPPVPGSIALLESHGGLGEHTLGVVREDFVIVLLEDEKLSRIRTMPTKAIVKTWTPSQLTTQP